MTKTGHEHSHDQTLITKQIDAAGGVVGRECGVGRLDGSSNWEDSSLEAQANNNYVINTIPGVF